MMVASSIVISMYNARQSTVDVVDRLLMPSLLTNGDSTKQLILLDDVSPLKETTRAMVEKYRGELRQKFGDFQYIENARNLGFAGSYNRGIRHAEGRSIIIANDDLYLPCGSIDSLISVLERNPNAGLVGPVANSAYGFQNTRLCQGVRNYSKTELDRIESFASTLREVMQGRVIVSNGSYGLNGFCVALRRDVLEAIGGFDERYRYGYFEDTDLNKRVLSYGLNMLLDASTFVQHGGPTGVSMSMKQHKIKVANAFLTNGIKYSIKWNSAKTVLMEFPKAIMQFNGVGTVDKEILAEANRKGIRFDS